MDKILFLEKRNNKFFFSECLTFLTIRIKYLKSVFSLGNITIIICDKKKLIFLGIKIDIELSNLSNYFGII